MSNPLCDIQSLYRCCSESLLNIDPQEIYRNARKWSLRNYNFKVAAANIFS